MDTDNHSISQKILSNKFHVICEKPFSINSDMSKKLVEISKKNNVSCLVEFCRVCDKSVEIFKKKIKKKQLNKKIGNFYSSYVG